MQKKKKSMMSFLIACNGLIIRRDETNKKRIWRYKVKRPRQKYFGEKKSIYPKDHITFSQKKKIEVT